MKKIYYLLAFVALVFTACQKEPALHSIAPSEKKDLTITLQTTDYQKLPSSDYPSSALTIDDDADAQKYVPIILNAEYGNLDNGSTAAVTYAKSALYFKPAKDSLYNDVAYTLTNDDYLLLPGNKYTDFSIAQVLQWLPYKYPTPVTNQLELLNFTIYPATTVPAPPYSFLYYSKAWIEAYTITPAQYTSIGLGKYNQFTSANDASLPAIFNTFLKNDITIQDTIKKGDIKFVSFDYYAADGNAYQRVMPLTYDGNNYTVPQVSTGTVNFIKQNGSWTYVKPLPIVAVTLSAADFTLIANSSYGTSAQRSDVSKYSDFSGWSPTDLANAFILVLKTDIKSPVTNTNYQITYLNYVGGSDVPTKASFVWDGTNWKSM